MAYDTFGIWIADLREKAGLTQAEVANRLEVTQQTVSRWEAGSSRPRRDVVLQLGNLLGVEDRQELLARAGFATGASKPPLPVRPLLKRLPLASLAPDDFEAFCRDFIKLRNIGADVSRFGDQGHAQEGIDLLARLPDGTRITYQCKRVAQFGASKVRAAVVATSIDADRHYLLLSRVASPEARKEMDRHAGWILEDVEDLSSAVRLGLSPDDGRRLVDTYFPGWRQEFLGIPRPGIWLSPEEFFRPTLRSSSILSHEWVLVGRGEELTAFEGFLASGARTFLVIGRGGSGKSRLLREISILLARESAATPVRFLAPETPFQPDELELLPDGCVLVVDDAHDRDDVPLLLGSLARSTRQVKVVLASRPYGKDRLLAELRAQGFVGLGEYPVVELSDLALDEVERLARNVLESRGGTNDVASFVARATRDCTLFTVIAGQLLAAGTIDVNQLANDETARSILLRSFGDAIVGKIGDPSDQGILKELLRLVALLQPLQTDSDGQRDLISSFLGVRPDRVVRHLRTLEEAGVLLRRGRKLRVVPDLLGDFLVADSCVDPRAGAPTGYADQVFALASGDTAQHIILNLAKLDWRMTREQKSDSQVLDSIWSVLTTTAMRAGVFGRQRLLQTLSDLSYYQPGRALELARRMIDSPTDQLDLPAQLLPRRQFGYDLVLAAIPAFLRGAAMHVEYVGEVCDVLWVLGRNETGALHSQPQHAVRILQDLAAIKPGKPLEFSALIVDRAIEWAADPHLGDYIHSPFDVMGQILATEGYDTEARGWSLNMKPFTVRIEAVRPLRDRVVECAVSLLAHPDTRIGVRAAGVLEDGLRYPIGLFGAQVSSEEHDRWTPEFLRILDRIASEVRAKDLDPVVEDRLRRAVNWHANFNEDDVTRMPARALLALLDDGLSARLTRALAHGWAHSAALPDDDDLDYPERERRWRDIQRETGHELRREIPAVAGAVDLVEERLTALLTSSSSGQPSPGPFLVMLFEDWDDAAEEVLTRAIDRPSGAFGDCAQVALAALCEQRPTYSITFVQRVIDSGEPRLLVQAASALTWAARSRQLSLAEGRILDDLAVHHDPRVRLTVARGLRFATALDRSTRLQKVMRISIDGDSSVAEEVVGNFGRHGDYETTDLTAAQIADLLRDLVACPEIDDYQVGEFLGAVSASDPHSVLAFLERRVARANDDSIDAYRPIPYRWDDSSPLRVREFPGFVSVLERVCDWLVEPADGWQRSYWAPHIFAAVAGSIDDTVLDALGKWAGSADPTRLETISHLLREMPRALVWSRLDWIQRLLDAADSHGAECYAKVASGLHSAVVSGSRSGTPGQPFPEDVEQRDRSLQASAALRPGTPAHRFYTALARSAEASIRWSIERDEEERPD